MIELLVSLVVLAVVVWIVLLIFKYMGVPPVFRQIVIVVALLIVLLMVLSALGFYTMPKIR